MSLVSQVMQQPLLARTFLNLYPPFLGAGIRVKQIDLKKGFVTVTMPLTRFNRNAVGTQFGGSLYAMTDSFYMLILMSQLGSDYVVWDKSAQIRFIRPGRGRVSAHFEIPPAQLADIRSQAANGQPLLMDFKADITDETGQLIAQADKVLYIRRKPARSAQADNQ